MTENPLLLVLMISVGLYMALLWRTDYIATRVGQADSRVLPGATPSTVVACIIAALGALVILAAETGGEIYLGLSEQQSKITVLFGVYSLIAAFIEELIFRGFLVINRHGKLIRWLGVMAASVLFALLHPFLWQWGGGLPWRDGTLTLTFNAKGWFSTAAVFASSLWFYTVRFMPMNPSNSLIPCFTAHATKNIGVFTVKAVQGFINGWW